MKQYMQLSCPCITPSLHVLPMNVENVFNVLSASSSADENVRCVQYVLCVVIYNFNYVLI